jgi:hypothetical protein
MSIEILVVEQQHATKKGSFFSADLQPVFCVAKSGGFVKTL